MGGLVVARDGQDGLAGPKYRRQFTVVRLHRLLVRPRVRLQRSSALSSPFSSWPDNGCQLESEIWEGDEARGNLLTASRDELNGV